MGVSVLGLLANAEPARATDFYVYKVTVKLVAQMVIVGSQTDVIVTRKIGNKEIINLALGRPLDTKVDGKTAILAGAGTYAADALQSKLIVFDPSQNGVAQIKATVGTLSNLDFNTAYLASTSQGAGIGTGVLAATTLGDPNKNGFLQSTFNGGGTGSGSHDPFGGSSKVAGKGSASGRLRFKFTDASNVTQLFDGIVVKAEGKASGKPIGGFTQ
jgi:hypothetical protein